MYKLEVEMKTSLAKTLPPPPPPPLCVVRVGREVHRSHLREWSDDEGAGDPGGHPERNWQDQQPQQLPHQAVLRRGEHQTGELQQGQQTEGGQGGNPAWKNSSCLVRLQRKFSDINKNLKFCRQIKFVIVKFGIITVAPQNVLIVVILKCLCNTNSRIFLSWLKMC